MLRSAPLSQRSRHAVSGWLSSGAAQMVVLRRAMSTACACSASWSARLVGMVRQLKAIASSRVPSSRRHTSRRMPVAPGIGAVRSVFCTPLSFQAAERLHTPRRTVANRACRWR
jgi:hypothetical protein